MQDELERARREEQNKGVPLLALPRELRDLIYQELSTCTAPIQIPNAHTPYSTSVGALQTCRTLRNEATPFFRANVAIRLVLRSAKDCEKARSWMCARPIPRKFRLEYNVSASDFPCDSSYKSKDLVVFVSMDRTPEPYRITLPRAFHKGEACHGYCVIAETKQFFQGIGLETGREEMTAEEFSGLIDVLLPWSCGYDPIGDAYDFGNELKKMGL